MKASGHIGQKTHNRKLPRADAEASDSKGKGDERGVPRRDEPRSKRRKPDVELGCGSVQMI
jgi:hypothetical protein